MDKYPIATGYYFMRIFGVLQQKIQTVSNSFYIHLSKDGAFLNRIGKPKAFEFFYENFQHSRKMNKLQLLNAENTVTY